MSSFFTVGDRYRDRYVIESVETFLDGELAVSRTDENDRYYLQLTKLKRGTQSRVIQQYRSLDHPLVLPFAQVFTEERSIVFIRPYIALTRLDERLKMQPWDEEGTIRLTRELLQLEKMLNSRPLPMYLLLDLRNMGLTESGELKVFFCGVKNYTALEPVIDWGNWMYMCMTGQFLEKPLTKLPSDRPFSGPMVRLVERSMKKASADQVLSHMETYEKRKNSPGLLSRLFGGEQSHSRPEKREKSVHLERKSARTKSSAEGKGKLLFGERIKTKLPSGSSEGSTVVSDRLSRPEDSPDKGRTVERPKVTPPVKPAESREKSGTDYPRAETTEKVSLRPDREDPEAEASVPSAEIEPVLRQDFTAATKEEGRRVSAVQEPGLEDAPEEKGEVRRQSPAGERESSGAVAPQPQTADVSLSSDRISRSARSDDSTRQKERKKQMDRLIQERLIRERREHDRLASQFREYTKLISGGGNLS